MTLSTIEQFVVASGVLALLYGLVAGRSIINAPTGNKKMQEIGHDKYFLKKEMMMSVAHLPDDMTYACHHIIMI